MGRCVYVDMHIDVRRQAQMYVFRLRTGALGHN